MGFSKSVFFRGLENDLAYTVQVSSPSRGVCLYISALARLREDEERRIERKVSVEAASLREKVIWFGRKSWVGDPLDFISVDEC